MVKMERNFLSSKKKLLAGFILEVIGAGLLMVGFILQPISAYLYYSGGKGYIEGLGIRNLSRRFKWFVVTYVFSYFFIAGGGAWIIYHYHWSVKSLESISVEGLPGGLVASSLVVFMGIIMNVVGKYGIFDCLDKIGQNFGIKDFKRVKFTYLFIVLTFPAWVYLIAKFVAASMFLGVLLFGMYLMLFTGILKLPAMVGDNELVPLDPLEIVDY